MGLELMGAILKRQKREELMTDATHQQLGVSCLLSFSVYIYRVDIYAEI